MGEGHARLVRSVPGQELGGHSLTDLHHAHGVMKELVRKGKPFILRDVQNIFEDSQGLQVVRSRNRKTRHAEASFGYFNHGPSSRRSRSSRVVEA